MLPEGVFIFMPAPVLGQLAMCSQMPRLQCLAFRQFPNVITTHAQRLAFGPFPNVITTHHQRVLTFQEECPVALFVGPKLNRFKEMT